MPSWDLPREEGEDAEAVDCVETSRASQVHREEGWVGVGSSDQVPEVGAALP